MCIVQGLCGTAARDRFITEKNRQPHEPIARGHALNVEAFHSGQDSHSFGGPARPMWQPSTATAKPAAPLSDQDLRALLEGVAARDKEAFRAMYHALRPALVRHLHRLLRGADQVDELVNDVMWVVWQNAGAF